MGIGPFCELANDILFFLLSADFKRLVDTLSLKMIGLNNIEPALQCIGGLVATMAEGWRVELKA